MAKFKIETIVSAPVTVHLEVEASSEEEALRLILEEGGGNVVYEEIDWSSSRFDFAKVTGFDNDEWVKVDAPYRLDHY